MDTSLDGIRCVMLDLDGTCYLTSLSGEVTLIEGVLDFLQRCDERGIARFFLSNNSSRSVDEYVSKLAGVGIRVTPEEVMLSTHDAISWLKEQGATRVHLMGTDGCHSMLQDGGIDTRSNDPQFVVIGYHNALSYTDIAEAAVWMQKGIRCMGIHGDMNCPSVDGGLPDVGSFLAMFEAAIGVTPVKVCGKPHPSMIEWKMEELGLESDELCVIGDRLVTDIEMATRAGVRGVLVLSGEATREDLSSAPQNPDLVVGSVDELLK